MTYMKVYRHKHFFILPEHWPVRGGRLGCLPWDTRTSQQMILHGQLHVCRDIWRRMTNLHCRLQKVPRILQLVCCHNVSESWVVVTVTFFSVLVSLWPGGGKGGGARRKHFAAPGHPAQLPGGDADDTQQGQTTHHKYKQQETEGNVWTEDTTWTEVDVEKMHISNVLLDRFSSMFRYKIIKYAKTSLNECMLIQVLFLKMYDVSTVCSQNKNVTGIEGGGYFLVHTST